MMTNTSLLAALLLMLLCLHGSRWLKNEVLRTVVFLCSFLFFGMFLDVGISLLDHGGQGALARALQWATLLGGTVYFFCALMGRKRGAAGKAK